jgi:hypothetical protein
MPVVRICVSISASERQARTRQDLAGVELRQSRLLADLPHEPQPGAQRRPVLVGGEEILPDTRRRARIGRG